MVDKQRVYKSVSNTALWFCFLYTGALIDVINDRFVYQSAWLFVVCVSIGITAIVVESAKKM